MPCTQLNPENALELRNSVCQWSPLNNFETFESPSPPTALETLASLLTTFCLGQDKTQFVYIWH